MIGSTREARQAGAQQAAIVTGSTVSGTMTKVATFGVPKPMIPAA